MSFSSVFVVSNALRLKGFRPTFYKKRSSAEEISSAVQTDKIKSAGSGDVQEQQEDLQPSNKEDNTMKKTMKIEGMMCGHCTGRVDKALNALEGVEATVSLEDKAAYVTLTGDVSDEVLKKTVEDEGYQVLEIV